MGKDNITFHSQIWPAELLGYAGRGDRAASRGGFGVLNLPTEVVSSEFLTMEGRQFSTSRGHVIYVRDVLERYGPDALRYFICAAGPENQDSDFTWAEFVQRNNSELVAGWGNLVNRTAAMVAQELRRDPAARAAGADRRGVARGGHRGFDTVGGLLERSGSRPASAEVDASSVRSTPTSRAPSPSSSRVTTSASGSATVLHTLAQA
jgi:methionyl-tRNA synthetase